MPQITEWEFTGETASRINLILQQHPELPFKEARVEGRAPGSFKRRDLTLYDRAGMPVLTGEAKMPDNPEGRTPFQQGLVEDAHRKADAIGVAYNFTWNVNRFVLWNTYEQNKPISERALEYFDVLPAPIHTSDQVSHPRVQAQLNDFWERFLVRYAALLQGAEPLRLLPLDEKFIAVYESSLERPVVQTLAAISERYAQDRTFKQELDAWMRDKQQWLLSSDEEVVRENLDRAAKFSCYVTANKIVFYKALRRRFAALKAIKIPQTVTTGEEFSARLQQFFQQARQVTRDYETVFASDYGDTLPFLNDAAVDSWRELSKQTDGFDFTQLNHEIIGEIFKRLLSPGERHKFGQHYTRSEVVDLINTFCYYGGALYKKYLQEEIAEREAPGVDWSGRSDIHVFFFPHAATFLREGGYLGLLTSSNWLDTTYGFRLQKYLLDHFEIIAIIESASEPWFTGARVTTAATILRKQGDPAKRAANVVHFVKLTRELSELLAGYEGITARLRSTSP